MRTLYQKIDELERITQTDNWDDGFYAIPKEHWDYVRKYVEPEVSSGQCLDGHPSADEDGDIYLRWQQPNGTQVDVEFNFREKTIERFECKRTTIGM